MTIEDFLRLLLRNSLLLVVVTTLGAAAGYGISYTQPERYSASALGYVSASSQADADGNPVTQASGNMDFQYAKAQSYLPLFNTRAVGQRVVDDQGLGITADEVAGTLQTTLDPNAPIITVTAVASDPQTASDIANAAVEATAEEARKLESGGNESAAVSVQLVPYQNALVPGVPVSPDREKFLAAGAAAGLLIALAAAWLRDRNDSRIRTADDVTGVAGMALLGTLPENKELARAKNGKLPDPKSFAPREAIRKLRTNLRFVDVDAPPRSIVVTSSAPGDGKSIVAANLARVMARAGEPTVLIDADLRRPMVASQFNVDGSVGLSQLLAAAVSLDDAIQPSPTRLLSLLPAGQVPPNPSELLGSRRMKELVEELARDFFVIIDAPPVLAVTDAQLLSRHVDGSILVVVPGRTRQTAMTRAAEALRGVGGKVYGVVMNRASTSRLTRIAYGDPEYGYGADGRYGYGAVGYDTVEAETGTIEVDEVDGRDVPVSQRTSVAETASRTGGAAESATQQECAATRNRGRRAVMPQDPL